jgi:hypothetical protein
MPSPFVIRSETKREREGEIERELALLSKLLSAFLLSSSPLVRLFSSPAPPDTSPNPNPKSSNPKP